MRRQSSYDRYSDYGRTADHRYYDSARAPEATSATYGYDRIDNRAGYYDQYQYRDYNQGYDYRYSQQHSYIPDYYEQPASIRDRADYSSYYALDTRRGYYDAYGDDWRRRTQDFAYDTAAYTYQNQTLKVETVYPTTPRGGDTATAPLSDRNASSKARLYSFGYRKAARGSILSPKKPSKSADGKPTEKSDTTNSTQVAKEEKPEEVSPAIQSLAKLTLSMINYRIALCLVPLNISIKDESAAEAKLFLRNAPSSINMAEASERKPASASVPATLASDSTIAHDEKVEPSLPKSATKRSVSSSIETGDSPAAKKQRALSIEDGMIREKHSPTSASAGEFQGHDWEGRSTTDDHVRRASREPQLSSRSSHHSLARSASADRRPPPPPTTSALDPPSMQRAYSAPYDSITRGSSAGYPANDSYAIRYPDAAGYNQQQLSASRSYSSSSRDPYSASQPMAYDHYGNGGGYSHGGYGAEDPYFLHQQSSRSRYFDEYADVGLHVDNRSRDYVYDSRSHRDSGYGVNNGYSDRDRDNYSARTYPGSSSGYIHPVVGSAGIASSATYEYEEGEHPHRSGGGAISGDAQRSRSSAAGRDYYPSDHYGHGGSISRSTSRSAIDYPDHRNASYDDGRGRYNNQAQTPGSSSRGVLEPGSGRRGGYDPRMVPSGVSYPGHASSSSYHQDKSGAPTLRTPR